MDAAAAAQPIGVRIALNRSRQRELYGAPLGDQVRRLTAALAVTQARLARALGMSPAMLSQLVSARRVKIGDPAVLARLQILDQRCAAARGPLTPQAVEALLVEVARARWQWAAPGGGNAPGGGTASTEVPAPSAVMVSPDPAAPRVPAPPGGAAAVLRTVAAPARLAAAAAALGAAFPELAEVLRQAAGRPRTE